MLRQRYPSRPFDLESSLQLDLGIDSLEWVTLSLEFERRLGLQLDEAETAEVQSVRQLVEAAQRAGGRPAASSERLAPDQRWIRPGHLGHRLLAAALFLLNRLLMRLLFRLKREGPNGALPARTLPEGRFVIVANHVSDLDPLVLAAALPSATLDRKSVVEGQGGSARLDLG